MCAGRRVLLAVVQQPGCRAERRRILAREPCWAGVDEVLDGGRQPLSLHGHGRSERGVLHRPLQHLLPLQHLPRHIGHYLLGHRLLHGLLWCWRRIGGQVMARAQLRLSVRERAALAELAPGRLNGSGNRRPWAGSRAPPPPLFGIEAAKALLSGPAGGPVQAGELLEQRVAARPAAI